MYIYRKEKEKTEFSRPSIRRKGPFKQPNCPKPTRSPYPFTRAPHPPLPLPPSPTSSPPLSPLLPPPPPPDEPPPRPPPDVASSTAAARRRLPISRSSPPSLVPNIPSSHANGLCSRIPHASFPGRICTAAHQGQLAGPPFPPPFLADEPPPPGVPPTP